MAGDHSTCTAAYAQVSIGHSAGIASSTAVSARSLSQVAGVASARFGRVGGFRIGAVFTPFLPADTGNSLRFALSSLSIECVSSVWISVMSPFPFPPIPAIKNVVHHPSLGRSSSSRHLGRVSRHPRLVNISDVPFSYFKVEETPIDEQAVAEEAGEELVTRRVAKRHKHGRRPLPDHLPRIEILHDLKDDEKPCPCCGELRQRIGEEVSEQLEYIPASFKVLKHVRVKYACGRCEHDGYNPQIVAAAKPPQPIEKGLPGPGLLAYVIVSKLGDHLPLYRLEHIFERQQLHIARSTMCAWIAAAAKLARPLVVRMADRFGRPRSSTPTTPACRSRIAR